LKFVGGGEEGSVLSECAEYAKPLLTQVLRFVQDDERIGLDDPSGNPMLCQQGRCGCAGAGVVANGGVGIPSGSFSGVVFFTVTFMLLLWKSCG
jgi:hypothetical protein